MLAKAFTELAIVSPVPSLLTYQNTSHEVVKATQMIPFNSQSLFVCLFVFKTLILVTKEGASI